MESIHRRIPVRSSQKVQLVGQCGNSSSRFSFQLRLKSNWSVVRGTSYRRDNFELRQIQDWPPACVGMEHFEPP